MARVTPKIWSSRSRLLITVGSALALAGIAWLTWWLLARTESDDGAGIANVLALPMTVVGTAAAIWGLRTRPRADDPAVIDQRAHKLLDAVTRSESRTLSQLIGDTGDPRPADVGFARQEVIQSHWRSDGGAAEGSLDTIADYYRTLRLGRLMVIGEPGAGKTVLVTRLLLDLAARDPSRVPVRLSLPALSVPDGEVEPAKVRDRIDNWIAGQVADTYNVEPAVAKTLVSQGRVLPILDGLDEMDSGDGAPTRARRVLSALNVAGGPKGWPVVMTCREARYREIAETGVALQDATVVTMRPMTVEQVVGWLAHRFPDGSQPDGLQRRWQPVVVRMRKHDKRGRLIRCLTNPLMLYLAAVVYHDDRDPRELCGKGLDELREFLLAEFIPAVAGHHPDSNGRHYDPADVEKWLGSLARHLTRMGEMGRSAVDLHLYELWRTTGERPHLGRRVRLQAAGIVSGIIAAAFAAMFWCAAGYNAQFRDGAVVASAMSFGAVFFVAVFLVEKRADPRPPDRLAFFSLGDRAGRRKLAEGLGLALTAGAASMLVVDVVAGLAFGVAMFFVGGVRARFDEPNQMAARPSGPLGQAIVRDVVVGIVGAATVGLTMAVVSPYLYIVPAVTAVLMLGIIFGVGLGTALWPHYVLATRRLGLPLRLGRLLDWAHRAGIVRLAGTATQFRHRELQDRLAAGQ